MFSQIAVEITKWIAKSPRTLLLSEKLAVLVLRNARLFTFSVPSASMLTACSPAAIGKSDDGRYLRPVSCHIRGFSRHQALDEP